MRQRRTKGIDERLAAYADLVLQGAPRPAAAGTPDAIAGTAAQPGNALPLLPSGRPVRWYQRPSPRYLVPEGYGRVYAEFGCGRGLFVNALASADPEGLYIGIEGCRTIIISALAKTRESGLANVRYIDAFVNDAGSAFAEGSLAGIFLNFSDPWPKDRHAGRRLTAPAKAEAYFRILAPGGFVSFKTDSEAFFDYSLKTFSEAGFRIGRSTRDLAACIVADAEGAADPVAVLSSGSGDLGDLGDSGGFGGSARGAGAPTEYELRFRALGQPIFHFEASRP